MLAYDNKLGLKHMSSVKHLTSEESRFFQKNGFLVKRNFVDLLTIENLQKRVKEHLRQRIKPFELEAEVDYPGSPQSIDAEGGDTIRRLLLAYKRDKIFKEWQLNPEATQVVKELLQAEKLFLVQSHHNCIMTKQPRFSSATHWHKDIRYWHFASQELVNTWLPLGDETVENGCLQVLPETQHWDTPKARLDKRLFLRKDLAENKMWLDKVQNVELKKGDLLFFHAALFHAAGRNQTNVSKNAVVSTYHSEKNHEIKNPYPHLPAIEMT